MCYPAHAVLPAKRSKVDSGAARADLEKSIGALVATLAEARTLALRGMRGAELERLLARARRELDLADEKLLVLDRYRQRSAFRQAGRIRDRIEQLQGVLAAECVSGEPAQAVC
jgi:hypothetical protein